LDHGEALRYACVAANADGWSGVAFAADAPGGAACELLCDPRRREADWEGLSVRRIYVLIMVHSNTIDYGSWFIDLCIDKGSSINRFMYLCINNGEEGELSLSWRTKDKGGLILANLSN
jgi:hypothetical protein